jgi:hypothetical protein
LKRRKKVYDDDDGRVIARMNVKGMPWYTEPIPGSSDTGDKERPEQEVEAQNDPLAQKETRRYIFAALGAALVVAAVFLAAGALFILFCTNIWLR